MEDGELMVVRGNRCSVVLAVVVARALAFLPFTTRGKRWWLGLIPRAVHS
jgi:hypothetical protein